MKAREKPMKHTEMGAGKLQGKANEKHFPEDGIEQVTPKNCDAGAFLFQIMKKNGFR